MTYKKIKKVFRAGQLKVKSYPAPKVWSMLDKEIMASSYYRLFCKIYNSPATRVGRPVVATWNKFVKHLNK